MRNFDKISFIGETISNVLQPTWKPMELSIRKAPLCLSLSMAVVSPHPVKLCHYKSNTMLPAKKVQHSQFLQCRCTELQRNITEQQGYNIYQRNSLIYRHILVLNLHSMFAEKHSTIAILVCNLFYPPSHLSFFFLISPFNSVIYIPFLSEIRRFGFSYLLFLCLFLPASIPFPDGKHRFILYHGPGKVGVFFSFHLLFVFLNRRLLSCLTVYCLSIPVWISV